MPDPETQLKIPISRMVGVLRKHRALSLRIYILDCIEGKGYRIYGPELFA